MKEIKHLLYLPAFLIPNSRLKGVTLPDAPAYLYLTVAIPNEIPANILEHNVLTRLSVGIADATPTPNETGGYDIIVDLYTTDTDEFYGELPGMLYGHGVELEYPRQLAAEWALHLEGTRRKASWLYEADRWALYQPEKKRLQVAYALHGTDDLATVPTVEELEAGQPL